jgi:pilus assembly protein CpaB
LGALAVAKLLLPAQGNVAQASTPAQVGVPVVVAKDLIKYGDRLEAAHLTIVKLPKNAVPEGAFSTIDQALAQDHGGAPVALQPIAAREPLLPVKLSGPGARPTVAAEIGAGMRAYTIAVSDVSGVGGHALPGDHVDVVLTRNLAPESEDRKVLQAQVVIQNVRVLGVDLNSDPTSDKPAAPTTATLEVSVQDAQKLSVAADLGKLSLALRGSGQAQIVATAPLGGRDVVAGAPAAPLTSRAAARPRYAAASARPKILVIEGDGAASASDD